MYVYQGEELGLPEVEDIPNHLRQDPMHHRSGGVDPGRDGCRVPMPWSGSAAPYGFSPDGATSWLSQPADWAELTVEAQDSDSDSILNLYRRGLGLRRAAPWGDAYELEWLPTPDDVLAFKRGPHFVSLTNFGSAPVPLPAGTEPLLASRDLEGGAVLQDTTVWLSQTSTEALGKERR
jgi:alpha-glucosidase